MENDLLAGKVAFAMTLMGTIEGEVDEMLIKIDPAKQAFYTRSSEATITLVGESMSYSDDEEGWYARDHNPAVWQDFLEILNEDDESELSFLDDLSAADYASTCATLGSVEVIEYRYEKDGVEDVKVLEQSPPYRFVSGKTVDPQLQDNFRTSVSYQTPSIAVDTSLPRMPITWFLEADVSSINDRGGIYMEATFTDGTEWAPFNELEFHLVDDEGTVYRYDTLDDAAWDLDDGDYFEFRDKDDNRMLSTGDHIIMDLGPGLDIVFYDLWADDYTI